VAGFSNVCGVPSEGVPSEGSVVGLDSDGELSGARLGVVVVSGATAGAGAKLVIVEPTVPAGAACTYGAEVTGLKVVVGAAAPPQHAGAAGAATATGAAGAT
jgi:hypothetical protein